MLRNIYILTVIITSYLLSSPVQSKSTNDYLSSSIKSTKEIHQWPTSTYELKHLKSAFKEFSRKNWRSSILRDYNPKDPVIKKILKWKELVSGSPAVNFSEIVEFVRYNPNWPSRETLNKKAEQNINSFTDPDDIIRWFAITPPIVDKEVKFRRPVTARGKKYLAEAMIKSHKNIS
jgi:hypothetical protein